MAYFYYRPKLQKESYTSRRELYGRINQVIESTCSSVVHHRSSYFQQAPRPALEVLADPALNRIVLLGHPGAGKSMLVRYLLLSLVDPNGDLRVRRGIPDRVPFLIELRDYCACRRRLNRDISFSEYLAGLIQEASPTVRSLLERHFSETMAVVIFDGLDEVLDASERAQIGSQILAFAEANLNLRIIVTSRLIGYKRSYLNSDTFAHFTLQNFTISQVAAFADAWYAQVMSHNPAEAASRKARILHACRSVPSIRELAGNPLLLTIMAIIGKHQPLPKERWRLYEHAATVLVHHWDIHKNFGGRHDDDMGLVEDDKKDLLRTIASKMQGNAYGVQGNIIHKDHLRTEIEKYVMNRFRLYGNAPAVFASGVVEQFHTRNYVLCRYGPEVYGFVHRAFLDYFAASAVVHAFEKTKKLTIEEILQNIVRPHWNDPSWHEVLCLIAGMIDETFAARVIDCVLKEQADHVNRIASMSLAVSCVKEVRNLNGIALLATTVLKGVCDAASQVLTWGSGVAEEPLLLFEAAASVGARWPGREYLVSWIEQPQSHAGGTTEYDALYAIGSFVGSVGSGNTAVFEVLMRATRNTGMQVPWECAAVSLATGWAGEPQVVAIIRAMLQSNSAEVRLLALRTCERSYRGHSQIVEELGHLQQVETVPANRCLATRLLQEWK